MLKNLTKDEYGFISSRGYGKTSFQSLSEALGIKEDENILQSSTTSGVRTVRTLNPQDRPEYAPGDQFIRGTPIVKAGLPNKFDSFFFDEKCLFKKMHS